MDSVANAHADTRPSPEDGNGTAGQAGVSLLRLYVLRFGYFVVGVGIVVFMWPSLIQHDPLWPLMEGVATCMLVALSLLALLGLRYPLQMLPVLLFEVAWKVIWLATVALPLWASDQMNPATWETTVECFWVVIPLAVIPWRYLFAQYVMKRGDRWRKARAGRQRPDIS